MAYPPVVHPVKFVYFCNKLTAQTENHGILLSYKLFSFYFYSL